MDRTSDDITRPADDPDDTYQPIELKSSFAPSGGMGVSATAYLLDASGTRLSGSEVTVWTQPGDTPRALGGNDLTGGARGAFGCAHWDPRLGALALISLQRQSRLIKVSIGEGCVAAGATFTPTALHVMDAGQDPSSGGAAYPTITNYSTKIGSATAATAGIVCVFDESLSPPGYLVIDAPCPVGC